MQGFASAVTANVLLVWYLAGAEGDAGHHPDNVVKTTNSGSPTTWSQTIECERVIWLGGRDLNPDNVVQSHVSYR